MALDDQGNLWLLDDEYAGERWIATEIVDVWMTEPRVFYTIQEQDTEKTVLRFDGFDAPGRRVPLHPLLVSAPTPQWREEAQSEYRTALDAQRDAIKAYDGGYLCALALGTEPVMRYEHGEYLLTDLAADVVVPFEADRGLLHRLMHPEASVLRACERTVAKTYDEETTTLRFLGTATRDRHSFGNHFMFCRACIR